MKRLKLDNGLISSLVLLVVISVSNAAYAFDILVPSTISGFNLTSGAIDHFDLKKAKLGTIMIFLSNKCPCSQSHIEYDPKNDNSNKTTEPLPKIKYLEDLAKKFGPLGFTFVGIHSNADEPLKQAREYFQNKLPFPVLEDTNSLLAIKMAAFKTPHVFVISPKLEILFKGGVTDSHKIYRASKFYLRDALESILRGKKPAPDDVRVLGCEIKKP